MKILKDLIVLLVLCVGASKIGNTQELEFDDGGVKLKNGCYTLVIVINTDQGKQIKTIIDCRGGKPIWKIFGPIKL